MKKEALFSRRVPWITARMRLMGVFSAPMRFNETGWVRDSRGVQWECRWQCLAGDQIPKTTRVILRRLGSDIDTHYVDVPCAADIFQPPIIDGYFVPLHL